MSEFIWILLYVVTCESIVQLIFTAAPLQGIRNFIIRMTPFLYNKKFNTHLLECRYCVSFWVGIILSILYFKVPETKYVVVALVIHRLSNHFHLVFSLIRDRQLEIRIRRNKRS